MANAMIRRVTLPGTGATAGPGYRLRVIGRCWLSAQADHQTARDHFREALALADQTQMPLLKAQTLTSYGVFLCRRGNTRSAFPAAEALRIADGCGAV